MELIDKAAIVAEIKGLKRTTFSTFDEGVNAAAQTLLDVIDTIEVKEVNLEKEVDSQMDLLCNLLCYMDELSNGDSEGVYPLPINVIEDLQRFAKHFFKLGMQQGKENFY